MTLLLSSLRKSKQVCLLLTPQHCCPSPRHHHFLPGLLLSPCHLACSFLWLLSTYQQGNLVKTEICSDLLRDTPHPPHHHHHRPPHVIGVSGNVPTWACEARYSLAPSDVSVPLTSLLIAKYSLFGGLCLEYSAQTCPCGSLSLYRWLSSRITASEWPPQAVLSVTSHCSFSLLTLDVISYASVLLFFSLIKM